MASTPANPSRSFDIVLWGATGFTGQLVAKYLVEHGPADLRLGLAGRNLQKLERIRAELGPAAEAVPLLVGDSHDRPSLDALAQQAKVVCSTVGPYAQHGAELVAACVEHGTSYCDLTGEVHFVRAMIDAHHERAGQTGARIVHCCGFDSIPSDLGVWMLQQEMRRRHGRPLDEVAGYFGRMKGGLSGGTIASMLGAIDSARTDRQIRRTLADPYGLNPEGQRSGPDGRDSFKVAHEPKIGMWTGPFVMASVNTRVVRRTNALLDYAYGRDFRYTECMSFGRGPKGLLRAGAMAGGLAGFVSAASFGPTRRFLQKRVPKPGEGPSEAERNAGFFVVDLIGTGQGDHDEPVEIRGRVEGTADPGYGETAKMLSQSAMCLAFDDLDAPGGVRTPGSTMGDALLDRLRAAGMTWAIPDR